jgi:hypothetical protein
MFLFNTLKTLKAARRGQYRPDGAPPVKLQRNIMEAPQQPAGADPRFYLAW